jgi:PAS domain-containing protein
LIARDGKETAIDDSAAPIRDGTGKISGVVMVFHDVTKPRQAETALRESYQSLSQARDQLEKRVQERTAELAFSNQSLQRLSGQLLRVQDEERRRIARELHDSTGQVLAALAMTLGQMQKDSSPANLSRFEECMQLITAATAQIRNLSYLLHPPFIDELGLASALADYAQGFEKRSGLRIQVEFSAEVGRFDRECEIVFFRIIQESLGNIQRHSGSPEATIKIFAVGNDLVLEIHDRGCGMPADIPGKNFGVEPRENAELQLKEYKPTYTRYPWSVDRGSRRRGSRKIPRAALGPLQHFANNPRGRGSKIPKVEPLTDRGAVSGAHPRNRNLMFCCNLEVTLCFGKENRLGIEPIEGKLVPQSSHIPFIRSWHCRLTRVSPRGAVRKSIVAEQKMKLQCEKEKHAHSPEFCPSLI